MAATTTGRSAEGQATEETEAARGRPATRRTPGAAVLVGLALFVASAYAAFASGAGGVTSGARVEVGVAAVALVALAALLYGNGLRVRAPRAALWGVVALVGFALWAGLSTAWSFAPDDSWIEANRALMYAVVAGLGVVVGSSLPRAAERAGLALLWLVAAVSLYALGTKVAPWLHLGSVIDLDQPDRIALSTPLGSGDALAMLCALAVPVGMVLGAEAEARPRRRASAIAVLVLALTTITLTGSGTGIAAAVVAALAALALGTDRPRLAAVLAAGVVGAVPASVLGVTLDDLTSLQVPTGGAGDRTGAGLILGAALLVGIAAAIVGASLLARRSRRPLVLVAVIVALAAAAGGFVAQDQLGSGDRLVTGDRTELVEQAWGGFTDRPVEGFGAGSFARTHLLYRDADASPATNPSSFPLQLLSETGIVGAVLALGGIALLLLAAARALRRAPLTRERAFAAAPFAGGVAFGVHLLVGGDWSLPGVALPALLLLGIACARAREPGDRDVAEGAAGRSGLLALGAVAAVVVAALAALPSLARGLSADAVARAASGRQGDLREAERDAALAKRLDPHAVSPLFAQAAIAQRRGSRQRTGSLLAEAADRQPHDPAVWAQMVRFASATGDRAGAQRARLTLLALDPSGSPLFLLGGLSAPSSVDPARSASAAGTPLPVKSKPKPKKPKRKPRADRQDTQAPQTTTPAPQTTTPTPTPAPTPQPTPTPTPQPTPQPSQPQGKPFRSEG